MKKSIFTTVLVKIFVTGFYRENAGMFIFMFVMFVSYCFFINTLGTVRPDEVEFWQFFFSVNLVNNPLITIGYLLICLLYTYKSWQFIAGQLAVPQHQFLCYSITSLKKTAQFKNWVYIQILIFIPVLIFTFYAIIIGAIFKYYLVAIGISLFLIALIVISATLYVKLNNKLVNSTQKNWSFILSSSWKKPIFLLFIFQVFNRSKLAYLLIKLLSWILILSLFVVFSDLKENNKLLLLLLLIVVMGHSFLIYQERNFNDRYLSFIYNFPFHKTKLFFGFAINYVILLLPELLCLFGWFNFMTAVRLSLFAITTILLFRSALYLNGMNIKRFLILIVTLFFLFYLFILFGLGLLLIPVNLIVAFLIFNQNYFNQRLLE